MSLINSSLHQIYHLFISDLFINGLLNLYRASVDEMRSAAQAPSAPPPPAHGSNMRSNLMENAAPMSFTGVPAFDSNVWHRPSHLILHSAYANFITPLASPKPEASYFIS